MADAPQTGSSDGKLFAALCYIINFWVPLFVIFTDKKNDKFVAFHAYQALVLLGAWIVLAIGMFGLTFVISMVDPTGLVGCLSGIFSLVVYGGFAIAELFCAYKAWTGEKFMFPVLGGIADGFVK